MKFTSGYWGLRDGVKLFSPVEVRDIRTGVDSLTVFAPSRAIRTRGDTLNTPQLTVSFNSPMPDVICVHLRHFQGGRKRLPDFELNHDDTREPRIERGEESISLSSGRLSVRVNTKGPWAVDFIFEGRRLTGSGAGHAGYVLDADGTSYMREQLSLGVGECVYGLGERFTPFVRNGQTVDVWNEDGGTSSEQAYKNIPFYLTNAGYGVLVAHPEKVSFEIASEVVSRAQFSVQGEELRYFVIAGSTPKEVLRTYTALTGRPALPPAWSFGLWLTTSFTTRYDEKTVTSFIDAMRERSIPLHVFHFDCFWMKEFQWCDFEWDSEQFPDPEGILRRLKGKGLRICVWINPYIAQKSRLFEEGVTQGFLVRKPDGDVWQWDRWQAGMGLVDFTNPAAVAWFKECLRRLVRTGVDCFKTDFGERIPVDVAWHNGADPLKMHNFYTYLYNRTVFELLEEERGRGQAVVFARSATTGSQKFPVHWGGDCAATYESMAESMRGGLSLGLSGFGFWSHDIGGFERTPTPDLYNRWAAFGLLSSHSRLHGNESYRVPWLFGEESVDVLRFFVHLKCSLMPYLFAAAAEASGEGIPMMRAMILEFPDDPACAHLDRQFMLGPSMLVAPVFASDGTVSYYLPKGTWTSFLTGERVEGGFWRKEKHGYKSIPLMVRPHSVIAVGHEETKPDYDHAENVTFHVFELDNGAEAVGTVSGPDGREEMRVSIRREGQTVSVNRSGSKKAWRVLLRNVPDTRSTKGGSLKLEAQGAMITPNKDTDTIVVLL